ncbi:PASTA domain-containing protein [Quadrisphaera oryzae]|uniref:PASTA domain-containing protein n=1 Tax=Quadrisphaera TaxID=317661 RepID=UPI0016440C2E|nr:PASTA domain-containing protein [Quadrisphaera sp. RL12-1S]MBC3760961.1 PASTA domain-containing protein [Quadrisphaera sp. RL12-1S]
MSQDEKALEHLEQRLAQALGARAALKTVEPAALGERLARVHAAAAGTPAGAAAATAPVVELPVAGEDDGGSPGERRRSRLLLAVVASAAAAAVIVAVALGAGHRDGRAPAPAATAQPSPSSSSSYPGEEWSAYPALAHAQWPSDLEGVAPLGPDVVAGSVRMLVQLGQVKYWAGRTASGVLCWRVVGPGVDQGGCLIDPATGRAPTARLVEVSDGSVAPRVWLVPAGATDAETEPLTAEGVVPYVHGVWVEASASPSSVDRYAQLRAAPTAADEKAAGFEYAGINAIVPGSLRLVHDGPEGTFVVGALPLGKLCFFEFQPGMAGSMCRTPQELAGEGVMVRTQDDSTTATAWFVPDDEDTSGWPALGREQLARNLWYRTEPPPTPEPVRSLTPEEEKAMTEQQPVVGQVVDRGTPAPDVVGLTQAEATWVLDRYHVPISEVTVRDAGSAPSGMVVRATPGADEWVPEGTGVHLVVAR